MLSSLLGIFGALVLCWVRFVAVWFVLHYTELSYLLFGKCMRAIIWSTQWCSSSVAVDLRDDVSLGMLFLRETGSFFLSKALLTALTLPLAWVLPGCSLAAVVSALLAFDMLCSLRNSAPPGIERAHENAGCAVVPPTAAASRERPEKWLIFDGCIMVSYYMMGIVASIYRRYGADAFANFGFAGASSGAWVAALACGPAKGLGEADELLPILAAAYWEWQAYPLGILFSLIPTVSRCAWHGFHHLRRSQGDSELFYYAWLTHVYFEGLRPRVARSVVPVRLDEPSVMVATSGLLPLMSSRLQWPTPRGRALDGFLHNPFGSLRPPMLDDQRICAGRCLIFGIREGRDSAGTFRINPKRWRRFSMWDDWLAHLCLDTAPRAESLFADGLADATAHTEDVDRAMFQAFGLRPLAEGVGAHKRNTPAESELKQRGWVKNLH